MHSFASQDGILLSNPILSLLPSLNLWLMLDWRLFSNSCEKELNWNIKQILTIRNRNEQDVNRPCHADPPFNPFTAPAWKLHRCTYKQYIFHSYNICFQCYVFGWKSFHVTVWKIRQKQLRVSNFAFLLVISKWHLGSEGVKAIDQDVSPFLLWWVQIMADILLSLTECRLLSCCDDPTFMLKIRTRHPVCYRKH